MVRRRTSIGHVTPVREGQSIAPTVGGMIILHSLLLSAAGSPTTTLLRLRQDQVITQRTLTHSVPQKRAQSVGLRALPRHDVRVIYAHTLSRRDGRCGQAFTSFDAPVDTYFRFHEQLSPGRQRSIYDYFEP